MTHTLLSVVCMFDGKSCLSGAQKKYMHLILLKRIEFSFILLLRIVLGVIEKKIHSWNSFSVLFLSRKKHEPNQMSDTPNPNHCARCDLCIFIPVYSMTFFAAGFGSNKIYLNQNMIQNWINIKSKMEYRWSIFARFLPVSIESNG